MKFLLLFFIVVNSLFATTINESLLKIHATLVPKISLMDYDFENKLNNNTITIAIMCKNSEYKNALSLKKKIDARYNKGIKSYKVSSELVLYKNIKKVKANIYYLFPSTKNDIKRTVNQANKNSALTFSYLNDDLQFGIMISLHVGNKIKPILNLEAVKTNNISLKPTLIDISTIYGLNL